MKIMKTEGIILSVLIFFLIFNVTNVNATQTEVDELLKNAFETFRVLCWIFFESTSGLLRSKILSKIAFLSGKNNCLKIIASCLLCIIETDSVSFKLILLENGLTLRISDLSKSSSAKEMVSANTNLWNEKTFSGSWKFSVSIKNWSLKSEKRTDGKENKSTRIRNIPL